MDKAIQSDDSISHKIDTALLSNLYQQAKVGFLASIFCATIIFIYLYPLEVDNHTILFCWYSFFLLIILFRFFLVNTFLKKNLLQEANANPDMTKSSIALWRNVFILGAFLSGISWGFTCSSLLLPQESGQQTIIIIILAGMTAGSVPLLAPVRTAAIAFLAPAIAPLILHFIALDERAHFFLLSAFSFYFIYLVVLAFKTHAIIKQSITRQFKNHSLLKNLSKTRNQLELINIRLKQDATHDPLTRVANRSLFEAKLEKAITIAKTQKKLLGLLYLDLDNFKQINDQYGHDAGDQLLLIIISRLENILREKDIIARLGGDEFTIILEDILSIQTITDIANRICNSIAEPMRLGMTEIQEHASIGISLYPQDGHDLTHLLTAADKAMYYAKQQGGNRYQLSQTMPTRR